MIKVISEFGAGNEKSLLLSLSPELLDSLDIRSDGSVQTVSLLKVLQRHYEREAEAKALAVEVMSNAEWMQWIMTATDLPSSPRKSAKD